jgi:L-alanine-DL-glutamate epimerase-like enolase superfamily enzyme
VDANGAWETVDVAVAALRALAPAGIEYAEEPVHGVEALRAVRSAASVRIAMDETAVPGSGAVDAVCLKVARSGGITGLMRDARAARAAGSEVYVSSSFDGPVGIAAGLHAAAALVAGGPVAFCGLATLGAFVGHGDGALVGGAVAVPDGPGLLGVG